MRPLFLLRWSIRDLRRRWLQVAAIALIIAIGTGVYSGLGSTATWRRESNAASFASTAMYDLRVKTADGVDAPMGAMAGAVDAVPEGVIAHAEERLVVSAQIDASTRDQTILVPGRIVGVDIASGGPHINKVWVAEGRGRTLDASDDDASTVVLERNFASYYDLPASGAIRIAGADVRYVGLGMAPEYFLVVTEEGGFFAQANYGVAFASLATAQRLADRAGRVNDLLVRLQPDADRDLAAEQVKEAFADSGLAVTVMHPRDEDAYRILYDDIESDQKFWNVFAALILAGAAFGAFNLASRMVEAQRREIGIGMALGFTRRRLMFRPLLVGAEIAVLGVILGVGMGVLADAAIRPVFTEMLPLPVWRTEFQPGTFARGAAIGFALPLVATAWPVWRATRVSPIDAIATTHRSGRNGFSWLLRRLPWPRSTYARMPLGNVLRSPRRTMLTGLAIGAALTALIVTFGMIDSFVRTMDRHDREVLKDHPDRVSIALRDFQATDSPTIATLADESTIGAVQPVLRFSGRLATEHQRIDVFVDATDLDGPVWGPTIEQAAEADHGSGLVISREAARDLGIRPGATVVLEHPQQSLDGGFEMTRTRIVVAGVHPSPFRFAAYVDRHELAALGLPDVANHLYALPREGSTVADVQRALFGRPGIASSQPVTSASKVINDSLDEFVAVFRVLEGFILLLALLIAYNAASINTDERRRDHATLFAFGLPLRRVVRMDLVEGFALGLLGTALGLVAGRGFLGWITTSLMGKTMPELGLDIVIGTGTIVTAVLLGVVAVAAAPLFTVRRLRRMDIPGTLRVVE